MRAALDRHIYIHSDKHFLTLENENNSTKDNNSSLNVDLSLSK